jgi:mono/diheme cytochrome c family protein
MKPVLSFCAILFPFLSGATSIVAAEIDFESEVQPIFEEHCFDCHGPEKQKGEFRLDRLAPMLSGGDSGEAAIVRGEPDASFLLKLVRHEEPDLEMPPKGDPLSAAEISLIEKWIAGGAKTPESYGPASVKADLTHWSFVPVRRPDSFENIDGFIREKLTEKGLTPSPEASRRTLIRRLFLVMLGIPPTPDQVDAFVADSSPQAWENLVEQVLASPRYGERWASHWLDLVRFGETNGFETNRERPNAWHFRDWVIESFNSDKPYDQFVREQIAGDTMGADVGTGFLVAGPFDTVKGQDPKLRIVQRMNELDDMINTTGTAFLGLTLGCARCHNHKFDPVTQKDYYSMQAIFAGVNHGERALPLPEKTKARIATLEAEKKELAEKLKPFLRRSTGDLIAIDDTIASHLETPRGEGKNPSGSAAGHVADPENVSGGSYTWWTNQPGKDVAVYSPRARGRYRVWLSWGAGHSSHTQDAKYLLRDQDGTREIAVVDQELRIDGTGKDAGKALWSGFLDAGVHTFSSGTEIVLQGGEQGAAITADVIVLEAAAEERDAVSKKLTLRPPVNARENTEVFPPTLAKSVRFTIDATSSGLPCIDELQIFDSKNENVALAGRGAKASSGGDFQHPVHKLEHINDGAVGNSKSWIAEKIPGAWVEIEFPEAIEIRSIKWGRDREGKYSDRVATGYRIEARKKEDDDWALLASSATRLPYTEEAAAPADLYDFSSHPPDRAARGREWKSRLDAATASIKALSESTKVYAGTFSRPGATYRLYRGEPDAKREEVGPDAVTAFGSLHLERTAPEQERRAALADWITDPQNPLTARVIANRLWQFHFGTGIVDTPSDFGTNGTPPSHPGLLDWLADELMANQWSLKHLHRLILNSQTWRQDSRPRTEAMRVDATSRLLWRFPTRRLEAEGIRDAILAASGALDLEKAGGPGFSAFEVEQENVRHYHPKKSYGPDDWRRMIYMTKVRQEKDAVFGAFDCPDASMVVPKRSRSTTPLQALNLLNSTFVLQQAELLAGRLKSETKTGTACVERAWELCFQRPPDEAEVADATAFIQQEGLVPFARAMLNANEFVFIP